MEIDLSRQSGSYMLMCYKKTCQELVRCLINCQAPSVCDKMTIRLYHVNDTEILILDALVTGYRMKSTHEHKTDRGIGLENRKSSWIVT